MNLLIALTNTLFLVFVKAVGDGEAGEDMSSPLFGNLVSIIMDRKAISVVVNLSAAHAFNKNLCTKV